MDEAGQGKGDGHEVHEGGVEDQEDVGGVAVAADAVGLEPDQPGEQEHEGAVHELDAALQPALGARGEHAIDEVHRRVLVGEGHEGQPREDEHEEHELRHLEGAAQGSVEDVARHHVDYGEDHHGKEHGGGDRAEEDVGAALPGNRRGVGHLPAATFLSSSRNSTRIVAASTPLAFAFLTQSSTMGAERFCTSATKAGLAFTIFTPDFFKASRPFLSASSHEAPASRARCSPESFSMMAWSSFGILFHLSSFMKKPKAELYMPPGKSVACSSTVSSLKETMDSSGKKVPSATPDCSSS